MKTGFWRSLEKYLWKVVGRTPLAWTKVGLFVILIVLLSSLGNVKSSVSSARNNREVVERAARAGDYELARELYQASSIRYQVLGAESDLPDGEAGLEDLVYPERVVWRRIDELEQKLEIYPGNREIYRTLSALYSEIGEEQKSSDYWEMVRELDPNDLD